ncbi:aminoglycoside phosphotransferase family protein [Streptomyces sp. YIM 130001]|uniref:phosphotransferase family protein n=1 Tax=Streptomyces sp. YIM 130001 TaxID=2259644 RepID=UPI001F096B6E|nr:aminoglycoside phosphotransferase family protein [Streptomyces sp. YIM 130001]
MAHPDREKCTCTVRRAVLADRPDGTVVRHGPVVAKAHAPTADPLRLTARIAVAARPALAGVTLHPLPAPVTALEGRPVSCWPYGAPVDPTAPENAPWSVAGTLLARLHRTDVSRLPGPLPSMRGPRKAAAALNRMRLTGDGPAAKAVEQAWSALPAWARADAPMPGPPALCHGDWHLGQLVRTTDETASWLLIDVDDLGLGVPAWDLARPAAWYASGLLPAEDFARFLDAYRAADGPAVPPADDPWPALDVPARALTVQTAATAVAKAAAGSRELDEVEEALVDSCSRMAALRAELETGSPG